MTEFVAQLTDRDWFNPLNKESAIRIAEKIELELDNMERKALIPDAYWYHRRRLSTLKGQFTRVFNKDMDEWLKARIKQCV